MPMHPPEPRVAVIIEDDADIRNLLEAVLTQAGFSVIVTSNGLDGVDAVREHSPVVTTLDVSMPGMDGFETAKRIRVFSSTYIVMLTARDDEIDTLQGLEAGADDYLTKPFRPRELRARIEAMLRRPRQAIGTDADTPAPDDAPPAEAAITLSPGGPAAGVPAAVPAPAAAEADAAAAAAAAAAATANATATATAGATGPTGTADADAATRTAAAAAAAQARTVPAAAEDAASAAQPGWLAHNGLRLNNEMRVVMLDGQSLELTRTEFDLLAALLESNRRVRSKSDLALLLRGENYVTAYFVNDSDKRAVEVHMGNLRRKLGDSIASPRWLETVRGVGYRLAASDTQ